MIGTRAPYGATMRELVIAAQLNDPEALDRLLTANEGLVRAATGRVVEATGADFDIYMQEARLEFAAAVADYHHQLGASFSTYVYRRMLRAVTLAAARRRKASQRVAPLMLGVPVEEGGTPEPPDPEMPLDERLVVDDAVDRLPRLERLVIRGLYWNDLSQAAIARRWGVSQQAVSKRHQAALTTLRSALGA